ncbi:putative holin-like toxin [Brevibacillus sp. AG]
MPVEVRDALTLMIGFGMLIIINLPPRKGKKMSVCPKNG